MTGDSAQNSSTATGATRLRPTWTDVPPAIRDDIEAMLGATVVESVNSPHGFSSGLAASCRLSDERMVFIKAASAVGNPFGAELHTREITVTGSLPQESGSSRLLHAVTRDPWVVLVLEHVAGELPDPSWPLQQRQALVTSLQRTHAVLTPAPAGMPTIQERWGSLCRGWRTMAADPDGKPDWLPAWASANVEKFAELEAEWEKHAVGDTLLHGDLRADNMLIGPSGEVRFLDWPWACVGAAFFDYLFMLPSMVVSSGLSPKEIWATYERHEVCGHHSVTSVLAALAGFFTYQSGQPEIPAVPGLREFQRVQGVAALDWLRERAIG